MLFTYAIVADSTALCWFEQYDHAKNTTKYGSGSLRLHVIYKIRWNSPTNPSKITYVGSIDSNSRSYSIWFNRFKSDESLIPFVTWNKFLLNKFAHATSSYPEFQRTLECSPFRREFIETLSRRNAMLLSNRMDFTRSFMVRSEETRKTFKV